MKGDVFEMITEVVSTLKIHKLTQEQYEREREADRLEGNAIYLTPDEGVFQADYDQNNESELDYIKNRPFYTQGEFNVEWDGNLSGNTYSEIYSFSQSQIARYCKVSEVFDLKLFYDEWIVEINGESIESLSFEDHLGYCVGYSETHLIPAVIYAISETNIPIGEKIIELPETGLYFVYSAQPDFYVSCLTQPETVKLLDEKYYVKSNVEDWHHKATVNDDDTIVTSPHQHRQGHIELGSVLIQWGSVKPVTVAKDTRVTYHIPLPKSFDDTSYSISLSARSAIPEAFQLSFWNKATNSFDIYCNTTINHSSTTEIDWMVTGIKSAII